MSDLTAARERHDKVRATIDKMVGQQDCCNTCWEPWPCDASLFRDALDEARTWANALEARIESWRTEHIAARALADELAEALRNVTYGPSDGGPSDWNMARVALAKWEASRG